MGGVKHVKIVLDSFGSFLGRDKGCLIVRDRDRKEERYPLFDNELGEIQIRSGNTVSSGALATCGFWNIDVLILTGRGHPIAILKSLYDDSHVKTRICQYRALENGKAFEIAKKFVIGKIEGQNQLLKKHGLRRVDFSVIQTIKNLNVEGYGTLRRRLMGIEGKCSEKYFGQIFDLFHESLRPQRRKKFKAYDGLNNLFNLAYRVLSSKVHIALIKAHLEPYLGFLHGIQFGKPSLVCDFLELYRYLMDDFLVEYARNLKPKHFVIKAEGFSSIQFYALTGDLDGDRDVDIFDIVLLTRAYGSYPSHPNYKPEYDIDPPPFGDGIIDIFDIVSAVGNYGKSC